ncbi:P-selectin-like isoform X2 [Branchiostoma floridae x Branchiostoma japonicum]
MKFLHRVFVLLLLSTLILKSEGRSLRDCSAPPRPASTSITDCNSPYHPGEECTYSCLPGCAYSAGSETRTCWDERWTGTDMVCTGCCSLPPWPKDTYMNCDISYAEAYKEGTVCSYYCSLYWHIPDYGSTTRTCSKGVWTGTDLVCKRKEGEPPHCSEPPSLANTIKKRCNVRSPPQQSDYCTWECIPGYVRISGSTFRSCSNGFWRGSDLVCVKSCPSPYNHYRDYTVEMHCDYPYQVGARCTFHCSFYGGYIAIYGSTTRTCSNDGTWTGTPLVCVQATRCQPLTFPTNGALSPLAPHIYPSTVMFTCDPGYVLNGAETTTCRRDGSWSNPVPTCTLGQCSMLTAPTNGALTPVGVIFTCNPGYVRNGAEISTCHGADGSWSNPVPTCTPRPCPRLTAPTNGTLNPTGPDYAFPIQVTVTCNSGYDLDGVSPVTCQADGTWSNPVGTCRQNECQLVDPYARRNCGWPGITAAECQERGCCWDNSIRGVKWCFNSTARPCPELAAPTNGTLNPTGPDYAFPIQVTVTCNSGYKLDGVTPVTCQADGTWSNPVGTCRQNECQLVDPYARRNCGWPGITAAECQGQGCCWDNSIRGVKWCFNSTGYEETTTIPDTSVTTEHGLPLSRSPPNGP